jgi:lipopolysaccharide heptosyltransferase II
MQPEDGRDERLLTEAVQRLLVIRLDNIGDVVLLSPALRNLRRRFPEAGITLMASPAGSQVAPLLPWIDDVFTWRAIWQDVSGSLSHDPQRERALIESLRTRDYHAAFIFTSFSQSPLPPAYACYLAGIPVRVGYSKEFGGGLLSFSSPPPADETHQADLNLALLELAKIPVRDRHLELHIPTEVRHETDRILEPAGINPMSDYTVLAPGASCSARRYSPDRFAAAAVELSNRTGMPVVVVGSQREAETIAPVSAAAQNGNLISLVGKTSLPQLAAIIQGAALVVANNSASIHLADAFQRPIVALYSGTEYESQWAPRNSPTRLLRRPTDCSPCYRFECPYSMECLDIPPREVVEAALDLLAVDITEVEKNKLIGV